MQPSKVYGDKMEINSEEMQEANAKDYDKVGFGNGFPSQKLIKVKSLVRFSCCMMRSCVNHWLSCKLLENKAACDMER